MRAGRLRLWLAAGLLAILTAAAAGPVPAAEEPPRWAYQLPHDLMSPYCPGRTLAECPSPQADELRLWILTQAAAGASREEVESSLYARFGDQIRSTPKAEGWGIAAYALPWLGFALGGAAVAVALRRLVSRGEAPASGARPSSPARPEDAELERRLDEELARE